MWQNHNKDVHCVKPYKLAFCCVFFLDVKKNINMQHSFNYNSDSMYFKCVYDSPSSWNWWNVENGMMQMQKINAWNDHNINGQKQPTWWRIWKACCPKHNGISWKTCWKMKKCTKCSRMGNNVTRFPCYFISGMSFDISFSYCSYLLDCWSILVQGCAFKLKFLTTLTFKKHANHMKKNWFHFDLITFPQPLTYRAKVL